jgi:hypothetical protein
MYYVTWSLALTSAGIGLAWHSFSTHSGLELIIGVVVAAVGLWWQKRLWEGR